MQEFGRRADMECEELQKIAERLGSIEERLATARKNSEKAQTETAANEQRLKSLHKRIDTAEGREEAAARDIQEIRLLLMKQETRIKAVSSMLKVFGSIVTAMSILIQIGRAVFL